MRARVPRYRRDEHARRGTEAYERSVLPLLSEVDDGKIVAVDIDSGHFEVADDVITASERLLERLPDAQMWFVKVGREGVHRFGLYGAAGHS